LVKASKVSIRRVMARYVELMEAAKRRKVRQIISDSGNA
jgi:hypothetical protein